MRAVVLHQIHQSDWVLLLFLDQWLNFKNFFIASKVINPTKRTLEGVMCPWSSRLRRERLLSHRVTIQLFCDVSQPWEVTESRLTTSLRDHRICASLHIEASGDDKAKSLLNNTRRDIKITIQLHTLFNRGRGRKHHTSS